MAIIESECTKVSEQIAPTTAELRSWLIDLLAETCELDRREIDATKPFDEYGLSSREAVELSGALEDKLDRTLSTTLLWEHPTIDQLANVLTEQAAEDPSTGLENTPNETDGYGTDDRIAVVGVGCRLPSGINGPDQFWQLLTKSKEAITELPSGRWSRHSSRSDSTTRAGGFLEDVAGFDAEFFGISPREAAGMDPQQRMMLEVTWEALEHAGIAPDSLRGSETGVFVGISGTEYGALSLNNPSEVDAWTGTGAALSIAANRISYVFDLRGPSLSVDTACSSSLTSVHLAVRSLHSGESKVAIAGGANLLLGPAITASFDQMGLTAADGRCKPFSAEADGIVRAEGAGVVVLKPLRQARSDGDRVLAVIRGTSTNSDGRSNGLTAPNPEAQKALLRTACTTAGVQANAVDYVEAHGTGTLLGDPIEARALSSVFCANRQQEHALLIGSVKSNIGHLEAAAGIAGLIKVVLALHNGQIPPSINYAEPNPHIPFDELRLAVADSLRPWPHHGRAAIAGVSGFGFGGTNTHVLLEQSVTEAQHEQRVACRRYPLAASHRSRLADSAQQLADWLDEHRNDVNEADLEYTMVRRLSGQHRAAVAARDNGELSAGLRALALGETAASVSAVGGAESATSPVFVFSGHGSQWTGMGMRLIDDEPEFASAIDRLDPVIRMETGVRLSHDLRSGVEATTMDHVQPLVYGIQLALAQLWRSYGVEPSAVIGHSFGEVSAAVVANALGEREGARIVGVRSRLLASLSGNGAMALLELDADEVTSLLDHRTGVDVAAYSAPGQTVIAGEADQVGSIVTEVDSRGLLAKLIKLDVAAHSPIVDQVTSELAECLAGLTVTTPHINFYSTAAPDSSPTPSFNSDYWAVNLRRPVNLMSAVRSAVRDGHRTFIELSPHPILRHSLADNIAAHGDKTGLVLSTLRNCTDETVHFHTQLATLELAEGTSKPHGNGKIIDLPITTWRHKPHWLPESVTATTGTGEHPLLGTHVEVPVDTRHLWSADLGSAAQPWLSEHQLDNQPVLTGSAYVEMASAAARTVFDVSIERIVLRELTIHEPLVLTEHINVTTMLKPENDSSATVTVHTKSDGGDWILHASVQAELTEPVARPIASDVDESSLSEISTTEVYERLNNIGVRYGTAFHGMRTPRRGKNSDRGSRVASAQVSLPESTHLNPMLILHPVLIDAAMQVLAAAMLEVDEKNDRRYLPVGFGLVRPFARLTRAETAHVSITESATDGEFTAELTVLDRDGSVLLEIDDVRIREFARTSDATAIADRLIDATWQRENISDRGNTITQMLVLNGQDHQSCDNLCSALVKNDVNVDRADYRNTEQVNTALRRTVSKSIAVVLPSDGDGESALTEAADAVLSVAELVATITEHNGEARPRILLATTGTNAVVAEDVVRPAFAALRGLVRVLAYEHPHLNVSIVDLDPGGTAEHAATALRKEFHCGTADEVALRGQQRYVLKLGARDSFITNLGAAVTPSSEPNLTSIEPGQSPCNIARSDGGYVITGGLGGIGIALAGWLAKQGAGRIVLNGRSEPNEHAAAEIVRIQRETNTEIDVVLGDIAEPEMAERLLAAATTDSTTPRGVIHAAAAFDDSPTVALDAETLHRSWRAKAYGGWRLHEATITSQLDWWVGFSSAAALHGMPGQPAYASANAYLDAIVSMRRAQGLPAVSIWWGIWAVVGAATDLDVPWMRAIEPAEAFDLLASAIANDRKHTGAVRLNIRRLVADFPDIQGIPFFSELVEDHVAFDREPPGWAGREQLGELEPLAARSVASAQFRRRVASVLGFQHEHLDPLCPLTALGVDSLLAVRIRNAVTHDFDLALPVSLLLRGASIVEAEEWLFAELGIAAKPNEASPELGSRTTLVPPRDAAERLVTHAWQEILGFDVGVTEDFYSIGGGRLQAEQVTAWLAERSGRELTVSELFEYPSIERMAAHLREEEQGRSPIRVLRETGSAAPLFFFHPGGGDTAVYRQLTDLLDADIPVYGFDRIDGITDVETRVNNYLPELRGIQPHGPYRIAGWSFGGFLAFEMAQQLRAVGERVEILAMIDSILPLPNESGLSEIQLLEKRFERFEEFLETSYGRSVNLPYRRLALLDDEQQVELLIHTMKEEGLVNSAVSDAILHHQRTSFLDARSLERYQPRRYEDHVVLFSAADLTPGGLRDQRFDRTDPARGWDAVCHDLNVITVTGHHLSLLDPPNVDQIAGHLDAMLARAPHLVAGRVS